MRSAAKRMGELIDDLIKLSRVERVQLRRKHIDLTEIGRRISVLLSKSEPARTVVFSIDDGMSADVDAGLAEIVLDNLLGNAWKFTARTASPCITFACMDRDGEKVFYVKDNGAGFDMRHAVRLFTPFQRLHSEVEFSGTGIGLATVQRIVDRHGGRVWAEGEVGVGATLYFTFPPGVRERP